METNVKTLAVRRHTPKSKEKTMARVDIREEMVQGRRESIRAII